jgi:hypothetical protein
MSSDMNTTAITPRSLQEQIDADDLFGDYLQWACLAHELRTHDSPRSEPW